MKKLLLFLILLFSLTAISQVTISPTTFEVTSEITITVDLNSTATDCNSISSPSKVYMHSGIGNDADAWGFKAIGNWGSDDGIGEMTNNNDGTWSITFTPNTYFSLTSEEESLVTKMGIVFRSADGSQELKATDCINFIFF